MHEPIEQGGFLGFKIVKMDLSSAGIELCSGE